MSNARFTAEQLRELTQFKVEVHDPRYVVEPLVSGGEFLYDPQVLWDWKEGCAWSGPEGSILISEIGGQPQVETDWSMGHGGLYRLHADNTWETIVAPGVGRQAGVFRPMIAPADWGDFANNILFGSQIVPHRRGAVMDHMIYSLAPGESIPYPFALVPRSGKEQISGAFVPGVFGRKGTPEEGLFLIFSMHNSTIYAVRPDATVTPWLVMDGEGGNPGPLMPYRMFYADPAIVGEENMLVLEGKWSTNFGGEQTHEFRTKHYRIADGTIHSEVIESLTGGAVLRAPKGFGPLAGEAFRPEYAGFMSSVHWAEGDCTESLPYTTSIIRRDADGTEHVFASNIQAGQNLIGFAGDRMIVTNMGHSYSSGNFKHPDGTVFAIRYVG
ncbi:conserved hypothetical protein [Pseudomonas sp. 9AZ]|uniref:hypothetical protein n=1 Tax=Pseudomonas sp. 9AZ TaxID=2653168 RepID=UPI0012F46A00|nr:hypothetical protein [Pseudomonas sp. 9AZ]VXD05195.1 conserved hypothetical protein [Pseudomonas sp. 9AZ]